MSHTPGPWKAGKNNYVYDKDNVVVAEIYYWDDSGCRKEDLDNKMLVAAAPEILEALELIVNEWAPWCDSDDPGGNEALLVNAKRVIAKAKGEE